MRPTLAAVERDGWVAVPGVLSPQEASAIAVACSAALDDPADTRQGDKRAGGTVRVANVLERVPAAAAVAEHAAVQEVVAHLLGEGARLADVAFRSPRPGFGEQSLHADDLPIEHPSACRAVTAIVALCAFTASNGATAVVPGSHRRPDLQRRRDHRDLRAHERVLTGPTGTAFVFSAHLLHRGTRNHAAAPRPALQLQWRR